MTVNNNLKTGEFLNQQNTIPNLKKLDSFGILQNNSYTPQLQPNQFQANNNESEFIKYQHNFGKPLVEETKYDNLSERVGPVKCCTPRCSETQSVSESHLDPISSTPESNENQFEDSKANIEEQTESYLRDVDKFIRDKNNKENEVINSYRLSKSSVLNLLRSLCGQNNKKYENFEKQLSKTLDIPTGKTYETSEKTSEQPINDEIRNENTDHPEKSNSLSSLGFIVSQFMKNNTNPANVNCSSTRANTNSMNDNNSKNLAENKMVHTQRELPTMVIDSKALNEPTTRDNVHNIENCNTKRKIDDLNHNSRVNDSANSVSEKYAQLNQAIENIQKTYKTFEKSSTIDIRVGESLNLLRNAFSQISELSKTISEKKGNTSDCNATTGQYKEILKHELQPLVVKPTAIQISEVKDKWNGKKYSVRSSVIRKKITKIPLEPNLNMDKEKVSSQMKDTIKINDINRSILNFNPKKDGQLLPKLENRSFNGRSTDQIDLKTYESNSNLKYQRNKRTTTNKFDQKRPNAIHVFGDQKRPNAIHVFGNDNLKKVVSRYIKSKIVSRPNSKYKENKNEKKTLELKPSDLKYPAYSKTKDHSQSQVSENRRAERKQRGTTARFRTVSESTNEFKPMEKTTKMHSQGTFSQKINKKSEKTAKLQNTKMFPQLKQFNSYSEYNKNNICNSQHENKEKTTRQQKYSSPEPIENREDNSSHYTVNNNVNSPIDSSSTKILDETSKQENGQNTCGYFVFSKHAKYRRTSVPQRRERSDKKYSENVSVEESDN